MFQKCPICNGTGKAVNEFNSYMTCDVCNGKKIISSLNGKPPIDTENVEDNFGQVISYEEYQKLIKKNDDITIKNAELNKTVELLIESNVNTEEEENKLKVFFEIPSSLGGNGNPFESKPKSFKERLNEKIEEEEERIKELNNFK